MAAINTSIVKAQQYLTTGNVIAIPTETVYGLAGNAYNEKAIAAIFKIKNRPKCNPLIVHIHSLATIKKFVKALPTKALQLAQTFWPGPLTLLFEKKPNIPDLVTAGLPHVGIRVPNHTQALNLLSALPFPLAAPSANPFGYISPTTAQQVQNQLGNHIPYILDGGVCPVGLESTIIGFDQNQPIIYRLGGIGVEAIENIVGPTKVMCHATLKPQAAGMLKKHYAPKTPLLLGNVPQLIRQHAHKKIGILCFGRQYPGIDANYQEVLSADANLTQAGKNFFTALRKLDLLPVDVILAAYFPDQGLGKTMNDRLQRASSS